MRIPLTEMWNTTVHCPVSTLHFYGKYLFAQLYHKINFIVPIAPVIYLRSNILRLIEKSSKSVC